MQLHVHVASLNIPLFRHTKSQSKIKQTVSIPYNLFNYYSLGVVRVVHLFSCLCCPIIRSEFRVVL